MHNTACVRGCHTYPSSACFTEAFFKLRFGEVEGRVLSSLCPSRLAEDSVSVEREEEERGEGGQGERDLSLLFSNFLFLEKCTPVSCVCVC